MPQQAQDDKCPYSPRLSLYTPLDGFTFWGFLSQPMYNLHQQLFPTAHIRLGFLYSLVLVLCIEAKINNNKFDTNKDASNKCENEGIFLNFLEFNGIY